MPPPYDTVVSIGGQSLVDGIWRLLGPALEGLTNPLPLPLPGFTNATMRITQLVPVFPGAAPDEGGALHVLATVEVAAEALLNIVNSAGEVAVSLGPQDLRLTDLTGTIGLPEQLGTLTDIALAGTFPAPIGRVELGPGTGNVRLPGGPAVLSGGSLAGTLDLPGELRLPGLPLPAVVPLAVDLTPSAPLLLNATLVLSVAGITPATRFGLLFSISEVEVGSVTLDAMLAGTLTTTLQDAVTRIVDQLGIPVTIVQREVVEAAVTTLLEPVPAIVQSAFDDALTRLLAETGRLVYPPPGTGASCEIVALPTAGDGQLAVAPDGSFILQVGFNRAGTGDIAAFPSFEPMGIVDCNLLVGNSFLLELLCCLVERLPAFSLPTAATLSTTDVAVPPGTHVSCCNFTGATLNLGLAAIGGGPADGISVCIDGMPGTTKTFTLVGHFAQDIPIAGLPFTVATVTIDFALPLNFDLDDLAAIANLRLLGTPTVTVGVTPSAGLILALLAAGFLFIGPAVGAVAALLVAVACAVASMLINNAVRTVLGAASLLRSPVAVPPGLFEAFGRFAPVAVTVDDLTADGVLHTPTSPWGLLPRIGLGRKRRPHRPPPLTHVKQPNRRVPPKQG